MIQTDKIYVACDMAKPGTTDYSCKIKLKRLDDDTLEIVHVEYLDPSSPIQLCESCYGNGFVPHGGGVIGSCTKCKGEGKE